MPRTKGAKDKKKRVRKSTNPTKTVCFRIPKDSNKSTIDKFKSSIKAIINNLFNNEKTN